MKLSSRYLFVANIGALFGYFLSIKIGFLNTWNFSNTNDNNLFHLPLCLIASFLTLRLFQKYDLIQALEKIILFWISLLFFCFLLSKINLPLPVGSLTLSVFWTTVSLVIFKLLIEKKEKKFLVKAFKSYVAPQLVEAIANNPEKLGVKGEKREITVLFSDLEGFTSLAEKLEPEVLVQFMNEYFTGVSQIIFRFGGTIDKFIGDSVMAFWNAPIETPEHQKLASVCALEISLFSKKFLAEKKDIMTESRIRTRIGINSGFAIVGNIGSEDRFSYTVMGDEINLASRIEGLNQNYQTDVLISESTYDVIKDKVENVFFRFVDHVRVKGREKPVKLFTVVAYSEYQVKFDTKYMEAFDLYILRQFELSKKILDAQLEDGPSKKLFERCEYLILNPPEVWDGIFEFKVK